MFCPKCGKQNLDSSKFCKNCGKPLPVRVPTPQPLMYQTPSDSNLLGQVLDGKYRIDAKLGTGGMGDVYQAKRILVGDLIAIKMLHAHLSRDSQAAERFRREAQTAIQLKHKNIVSIYDVGISARYNVPYLLMELAKGLTLRQVIRQNGVLPLDFAVTMTAQACGALEEAHKLGIIHRDIKPENIIVNKTAAGWQVKILDFGIAKLYNQTDIGLTQDGNAMGTPQYMSPEQCMGEVLDGRSDLYSVAIVVYELLCGTVPFKSASASAVAIQQVQNLPPPLRSINPDVPPQVEAVIMRALEKNREARQPNAPAFAQELIQAATAAMREGLISAPQLPIAADIEMGRTPPDVKAPIAEEKIAPASDPPEEGDEPFAEADTETKDKIPAAVENIPAETDDDQPQETLVIMTPAEIDTDRESKAEAENIAAGTSAQKLDLAETVPDLLGHSENAGDLRTQPDIGAEDASRPGVFASPSTLHTTDENEKPSEFAPLPEEPPDFLTEPEPRGRSPFLVGALAIGGLIIVSTIIGFSWFLISGNQPTSLTPPAMGAKDPNGPPVGMTYVPGGEFTMGADKSIDEKMLDTPAHKVSVNPFFIDLTEVTNEDYQKFVAATKHKPPPDWKSENFPQGKAKFPVTGVDWDDANAYAKWAGKRLPTEEEWEFAARGTEDKIYPWGDAWNDDLANANKQRREMLEVGKTAGKSRFGLSDMSGNAWEWTATEAKAYPGGKTFDNVFVDPKIIRGGYWGSSKEKATATFRRAYGARNEKEGYGNTGFRCVRDLALQ